MPGMCGEWRLGHHDGSSGCVCEGIMSYVGFECCIKEFRFFTLSRNYERFLRWGGWLIIYSKKIILSAVENIYWGRKWLGSGGGIKRKETMNLDRGQKDAKEWPLWTGRINCVWCHSSRSGVGTLWPMGQSQLSTYFWRIVLFGDSQTHSFTYCLGCFGATLAELSSCGRDLVVLRD